jgi:hypothetical protein
MPKADYRYGQGAVLRLSSAIFWAPILDTLRYPPNPIAMARHATSRYVPLPLSLDHRLVLPHERLLAAGLSIPPLDANRNWSKSAAAFPASIRSYAEVHALVANETDCDQCEQ